MKIGRRSIEKATFSPTKEEKKEECSRALYRGNVAENVEDTRRLFVRTAFVRWFNCHRKVVLNFTLSRSGEFEAGTATK